MKDLVKKILQEIGEDPSREGLQNTPERVEKSLKFLTSGYWVIIEELVNGALFKSLSLPKPPVIALTSLFFSAFPY